MRSKLTTAESKILVMIEEGDGIATASHETWRDRIGPHYWRIAARLANKGIVHPPEAVPHAFTVRPVLPPPNVLKLSLEFDVTGTLRDDDGDGVVELLIDTHEIAEAINAQVEEQLETQAGVRVMASSWAGVFPVIFVKRR